MVQLVELTSTGGDHHQIRVVIEFDPAGTNVAIAKRARILPDRSVVMHLVEFRTEAAPGRGNHAGGESGCQQSDSLPLRYFQLHDAMFLFVLCFVFCRPAAAGMN